MQVDSLVKFGLENKALIGLGSLTFLSIYFWMKRTFFQGPRNVLPNMTPQVKDYKKDVVYLFQFPLLPGGKNSSPFCLKLEAYLQKNGIPYEVVKGDHYNKNPKQKLPAIEFNGEAMSDSTFIIQYLKTKFGDPDRTLSASDAAIATAFQRLIEDHLYFAIVYFRWIHSSSWPQWSVQAFRGVPAPIRPFIKTMVRKNVNDQLWFQGFGRHTEPEILKLAQDDLDALSAFLDTKKFLFGNELYTVDIILYAALASVLHTPLEGSPLLALVKKYDSLVKYTERVHTIVNLSQKKTD